METKVTFTFTFTVGDRSYSFNEIAGSRKEALVLLKNDLVDIISQISLEV